jgi:hypothetical protein
MRPITSLEDLANSFGKKRWTDSREDRTAVQARSVASSSAVGKSGRSGGAGWAVTEVSGVSAILETADEGRVFMSASLEQKQCY